MAGAGHTITLYTAQADPVIEAIRREGTCFSTEAYVQKKYGESAPIFVTAYSFFAREAAKEWSGRREQSILTGPSMTPIMWILREAMAC